MSSSLLKLKLNLYPSSFLLNALTKINQTDYYKKDPFLCNTKQTFASDAFIAAAAVVNDCRYYYFFEYI